MIDLVRSKRTIEIEEDNTPQQILLLKTKDKIQCGVIKRCGCPFDSNNLISKTKLVESVLLIPTVN